MLPTPLVVALAGVRWSGKDTVADVLCRHHGFQNLKFATPLKRGVAEMFGLTLDEVDGPAKDAVHPVWGVPPRRILQWLGTDVMQFQLPLVVPGVQGRSFWAWRLCQDVRGLVASHQGPLRIVVSDVRFQHELHALQTLESDGLIQLVSVRLERPSQPSGNSGGDSAEATHASEIELASVPVDAVVQNDGSPADLVDRVLAAVSKRTQLSTTPAKPACTARAVSRTGGRCDES